MHEKIKEAFEGIWAEEELKNHTKNIVLQNIQEKRYRYRKIHRRLAAVMVCFLFLAVGVGGWSFFMIPVSAVSVDVNPSVELGINRFDKVVSEKSFNKDGETLLSELDLRFMDYRDAIEALLERFGREKYNQNAQAVSITVSGENEQMNEKMISDITSCAAMSQRTVSCSSCDPGEAKAAHEAGISLGKYKAFLELKRLDDTVTVEEIKELSMHQIRSRINALSGNTGGAEYEEDKNLCFGNNCSRKHGEGRGRKQKRKDKQ